jgi:hypothetical protein
MSQTICLDKVLTWPSEPNTVLREPPCGPISISKLRASEIARRRTEEERAEALFLCERRRRRIQSAMREQLDRRESNE